MPELTEKQRNDLIHKLAISQLLGSVGKGVPVSIPKSRLDAISSNVTLKIEDSEDEGAGSHVITVIDAE